MPKGYKDLLLKEVKELLKKLPPNVRIRVYYDGMGKSKYTLNQLGNKVDQIGDALFEFIKTTNARFDKLEKDFNSFKQEVNEKFDRIDARLDYNGLKKLPEVH